MNPHLWRAERHLALVRVDLPLLLELRVSIGLEQRVEVPDDLEQALEDLLRAQPELLDEPVDLVDVQERLDFLLHGLPQDGLGLRHDALDAVHDDDPAVHHAQRPCDVAGKVDVPGGVDKVDHVALPILLVQEAHVRGLDRHLPELLDLDIVQCKGLSRNLLGD